MRVKEIIDFHISDDDVNFDGLERYLAKEFEYIVGLAT